MLIYAVRRRLSDLVDLLINSASVARRDARRDKSPLDHAVQINDFPLCIRLVEEATENSGTYHISIATFLLTMAAQLKRYIVQKLIAAGFNFSDEVECRGGALIGGCKHFAEGSA